MQNLQYIGSHVPDALARLVQQYQDSGNFKDLVAVLAARWQGVEDKLWSLFEGRQLPNATGKTLELAGNHVGIDRPVFGPATTDDNAYRVLIYAKIAENISYGTVPNLYNLLGALGLTSINLMPTYPASLTVNFISNSLVLSCGCIRAILNRATHPIAFDITEHTAAPFGFEGNTFAFGFDVGQLGNGA